jgi:hypothetical protein
MPSSLNLLQIIRYSQNLGLPTRGRLLQNECLPLHKRETFEVFQHPESAFLQEDVSIENSKTAS